MPQYEQGDILSIEGLNFPVLVVSKNFFHQSEQAIVCPIRSKAAPDPLHIKIISGEPATSPFLTEGIKGPHKIEGIGAGFKPDILDTSLIDKIYTITSEEAYAMAKLFPTLEGLMVGISTGANLVLALKAGLKKGDKVVIINPDSGERYLSTTLYK